MGELREVLGPAGVVRPRVLHTDEPRPLPTGQRPQPERGQDQAEGEQRKASPEDDSRGQPAGDAGEQGHLPDRSVARRARAPADTQIAGTLDVLAEPRVLQVRDAAGRQGDRPDAPADGPVNAARDDDLASAPHEYRHLNAEHDADRDERRGQHVGQVARSSRRLGKPANGQRGADGPGDLGDRGGHDAGDRPRPAVGEQGQEAFPLSGQGSHSGGAQGAPAEAWVRESVLGRVCWG